MFGKDMSLKWKLGLGFGIVFCLFGIASIITVWVINSNTKLVNKMNSLSHLNVSMKQRECDHLNWLINVSQVLYDDSITELKVKTDPETCKFGKWYHSDQRDEAEKIIPDLKQVLEKIESPHTRMHQSAVTINNYLKNGDMENVLKTYTQETRVQLNEMKSLLNEIEKVAQAELTKTEEAFHSQSLTGNLIIVFISVLAVIAGLFVAFLLTKKITLSLGKGVTLATDIESGDLTQTADVDSQDELGQLLISLNNMSHSLNNIVSGIISKAENTASMALELSSSVTEVSATTSEIAGASSDTHHAVETTSTAITEMGSNIQQLSQNIRMMSENFETITTNTNRGAEAVQKSIESMGVIKESSEKIANIVNVITEIAGQTNLLSLNAAIEAAKAGEHGKGFAVVAEEVRKLAERSAGAAKEITELIHESTRQVDSGSEIIGNAGDALEEILGSVGETSALVHEINSASEEQARGVDEIIQSTDSVAELSTQNASSSEEISSTIHEVTRTVEELAQLSEQLMNDVSIFKI